MQDVAVTHDGIDGVVEVHVDGRLILQWELSPEAVLQVANAILLTAKKVETINSSGCTNGYYVDENYPVRKSRPTGSGYAAAVMPHKYSFAGLCEVCVLYDSTFGVSYNYLSSQLATKVAEALVSKFQQQAGV